MNSKITLKYYDYLQELLSKAFRTLLLQRMRSILSTLGILFGVAAVVSMLSIGEGAKQETLEQIEMLGTQNIIIRQIEQTEDQIASSREKRSYGLSLDDISILKNAVNEAVAIAPIKNIEASIYTSNNDLQPEIIAIDSSFHAVKNLPLSQGRNICDQDNKHQHLVCVLGYDVATSLGKNSQIGSSLRIENLEFKIIGYLSQKHWKAGKSNALTSRNLNKTIFIPLSVRHLLLHKTRSNGDSLSEAIVKIDNSNNMNKAVNNIKHILNKTHNGVDDFQIIVPQELIQQALKTQYTFNLVLGSIATVSLLVGGIGIMNIMLATVSERTREIGIRRAVGANKKHIAMQFLVETVLLTLIGASLGAFFGIAFSYFIANIAGWKTVVTTWSLLLAMFMSSIVGVFSGLYPALTAASMNPINALRRE